MKESVWDYCMRTGKTHLLCEWSCKKNGIKLSPRNITSANGRKVWWECGAGHTWMAAVYARAKQDAGCPFCTNHKVWPGFNDVASQSPELAMQWYQPLNGARTPENTLARSHAKVWWRCEIGHIWCTQVQIRAVKGHGCPVCARQKRQRVSFTETADETRMQVEEEKT